MANTTSITRRQLTNLNEPQQLRELNRQMEWIWHQLLGGLTEKSMSTVGIKQVTNRIETTVASNLTVTDLQANAISAAMVDFLTANIDVANIDFANLNDLQAVFIGASNAAISVADIDIARLKRMSTDTAFVREQVGGKVFIDDLAVSNANIVDLAAGTLMIRDANGNMVELYVDGQGQIQTRNVSFDGDDIVSAGSLNGNRIIQNTITADRLDASEIFAASGTIMNLIGDNIDASRIHTGSLDASTVSVTNINASNITSGTLNAARIAANSIAVAKLSGSISNNNWVINLTDGTLTIGNISAANINAGTLNAARIAANSIAVAKLTGTISNENWSINLTDGTFTLGNLSAANITSGTMSAARISGGILKLGGASNGNGQMELYNASGTKVGTWTNGGMYMGVTNHHVKLQSSVTYHGSSKTVPFYAKSLVDTNVYTEVFICEGHLDITNTQSSTETDIWSGNIQVTGSTSSDETFISGGTITATEVTATHKGTWSGSAITVAKGGTGSTTAKGARTNLQAALGKFTTGEVDTGCTWTNGKTIYRYTFSYTTTETGDVTTDKTLPRTPGTVIGFGGAYKDTNDNNWRPMTFISYKNLGWACAYCLVGTTIHIYIGGSNSTKSKTFNGWIDYTAT